jgi:hypothetical protein
VILLVVITLVVFADQHGQYYMVQAEDNYQMNSWYECENRKHQLEFLPPLVPNSAQVYFCEEGA